VEICHIEKVAHWHAIATHWSADWQLFIANN